MSISLRSTSNAARALAWIAPLLCTAHAAASVQQKTEPTREQSALAEDQALLLRQIQRLRQTMDVLAQRFETEGRTHAAKLLRDGLAHLDQRAAEQGSKTLEEMMTTARTNIEAGQSMQSIETQESVVRGLERLYAILTDRQGLEDLERSLGELKAIQLELGGLADREQQLHKATEKLEQQAAGDKQRTLAQGLQQAIEAQRELLARTESEGRQSNGIELEAIERALEELIHREATDASVLQAWKPAEKSALDKAAPNLSQANEHSARAQRLEQAASELRSAARGTRAENGDLQAQERALEQAAEREERHQRASGDPAAAKAADALKSGAETLRKSGTDAGAREESARALEKQAAELAAAAAAETEAAQAAQQAALEALEPLKDASSAAGHVAEGVRKALAANAEPKGSQSKAVHDSNGGAGPDAAAKRSADVQRASEEAQRALQQGLDDLALLKQALSTSQKAAAEEAQRLKRELDGLPEGASKAGNEAKAKLDAAAQAERDAADRAAHEEPQAAARAAGEAQSALEAARDALNRAQSQSASARAQSAEARALQQAQEALASKMSELEQTAGQSELSPSSKQATEQALESAQKAMQKAAQSLAQGKSSSAASAQGEAVEEILKAEQAAQGGTQLSKPEDQQRAKELAQEQERIRQKLLELAQRNQKRETAEPSPNLDKAAESANEAQQQLSAGDTGSAQSSEEDTERKLRQAAKDLGHEEEQYQKLRQEELLFKITEQVKAMSEEHQQQMHATLEVDRQRKPGESATHTQRLRLRKIAKAEEALGGRAGEIEKALLAEESAVFAEVLSQAQHDLERLGRDMGEVGEYQSGERIQALQQDVDQSLQWLLEALQAEKERRKEEQQKQQKQDGKGQQPGENRLVPDVAELKLLRRLEVETLDDLERLQILHPEIKEGGAIDPLVLEDIARLANHHQRTSDLFQKFRKRLHVPDSPDQQ